MPINNFLTFAAGAGSNTFTQAEYEAQSTLLANGVTAGLASSKQFNKTARQSSIITKVVTDFISNKLNVDCIDDGTTATLTSNLMDALLLSNHSVAGGTTSAYTLTYSPSISGLYNGMLVAMSLGALGSNTITNPTLNVNGKGAYVIVKELGALRLGDIPAFALLQYKQSTTQWVLLNPVYENLQVATFADVKASGTQGGNSAATTTQVRTLNTTDYNSIVGCSLASNQITLPKGTYRIEASAPSYSNGHRLMVYNNTTASFIATGQNAEASGVTYLVHTNAILDTYITLSATSAIDIRHYTAEAITNGLGTALSTGFTERYLQVTITKIGG